jgi:serine protease Do
MGVQIRELVDWVRRRKIFALLLVLITLSAGIMIGTVVSGRVQATHGQGPNGATLLSVPDPVQLSGTFSGIATKLAPAVVNINTTSMVPARGKGRRGGDGDDDDDQGDDNSEDFFHHFFDGQSNAGPNAAPEAERSLGSGVVVDEKGYILTNNHVVDGASKIQVALAGDQTFYNAKVIGVDKETDLAVIKIDAGRSLTTAKLGNSDGTQVGDWVLAFGSPFGLNATVTAGIISAKDRNNISGQQFEPFIQTDAAINPGNSGGPLVNMAGEVIGINTAIYTGSRGFEGVGFALPSNTAISVYNDLVTKGKVTRGSIGIVFQEDHGNNAIMLKELGAPYGIQVEAVESGSPAEKAGLQAGDVISDLNGRPIHAGNDLVNPVAATPIGNKVHLRYYRSGKPHEADVTVADRTKIFPKQTGNDTGPSSGAEPAPSHFGMHTEDLTPELERKLGIPKLTGGIIVMDVEPGSFGEDIGFTRGDVITEVNRAPVTDSTDYRKEIAKLKPGQDVLFRVVRRTDSDQALTIYLAGAVPSEQ